MPPRLCPLLKSVKFNQAQLPAVIYGNGEITCGNSYSTVWHVAAWANSNTPIAGNADYCVLSARLKYPEHNNCGYNFPTVSNSALIPVRTPS